LAVEILALRQQVAVYQHPVKRPKLRARDRIFWVWLSRLWSNWRSALAVVQPATVNAQLRNEPAASWPQFVGDESPKDAALAVA
jgi:hypothetical protein